MEVSDDDERLRFAEQLLSETREEVARADSKASLLLTGLTVVVAAMSVLVLAGTARPLTAVTGAVEILLWLGFVCLMVALAMLGAAIWPRSKAPAARTGVAYYGDVSRFDRLDHFKRVFLAESQSRLDRNLDQVFLLAKLVTVKYRLFKAAVVLVGVSTVSFTVLAVVVA